LSQGRQPESSSFIHRWLCHPSLGKLGSSLNFKEITMFLLNVSYTKAPAQVEPQIKAHGDWVTRYLNDGIFLFAGPKKSGLGGVIAVKAIEKQRLMTILSEDSYVQADVAEYQIIDFDCKIAHSALESLKQA
jgi:uncharacterized protein YciI